ncbi:hypothetical protein FAZ15_19900 [Sphingobacterium olei]|uniref:DUF2071 domain-containing protein n=1 Tax=Sphingobacterium olei TaxID=2571155 RepID=A0A4U0NDE2_9SPHI|nr:DUF2071 domain-containing protein [Sphingobacterium olei]TJZ51813.1 hypothetical protein FAZ15_19900 [Sphingobacterium olei]
MRIPIIQGIIERRLLINFVAEPEYVQRILPPPFRPKIYRSKAVVGICLIRLKNIRPKGLPKFMGVNSENGAHRIAVEWDENGEIKEGVFIPRRDTSSKLNALVGGRLFPGKHFFAKFNVNEQDGHYHVDFTSSDNTYIHIDAKHSECFDKNSIFKTLKDASEFFKAGSIGYSPNGRAFDGLELDTYKWKISPLEVEKVKSSFFDDRDIFPTGTVQFDNALLMEKIEHQWKSTKQIKFP